jgi:ABC-type phosphate transport system permease subunit
MNFSLTNDQIYILFSIIGTTAKVIAVVAILGLAIFILKEGASGVWKKKMITLGEWPGPTLIHVTGKMAIIFGTVYIVLGLCILKVTSDSIFEFFISPK